MLGIITDQYTSKPLKKAKIIYIYKCQNNGFGTIHEAYTKVPYNSQGPDNSPKTIYEA